MLHIRVLRSEKSFDFRANPNKPHSFENNWKNNRLDWLCLMDDEAELYRCRVQSVANYCFGEMETGDVTIYGDTIAPGKFQLKCFVPPRKFHGEIHAIINTTDLDGQRIDHEAMQMRANGFQTGRWLVHSCWSDKRNGDTNTAWSAGCFITSSADLEAFNTMLHAYKVQAGDIISGEVIEFD